MYSTIDYYYGIENEDLLLEGHPKNTWSSKGAIVIYGRGRGGTSKGESEIFLKKTDEQPIWFFCALRAITSINPVLFNAYLFEHLIQENICQESQALKCL